MGLLNYWVSVLGEFQALSEKKNGEWRMRLLNYWVSVLGEFQALSEKKNGEWRMRLLKYWVSVLGEFQTLSEKKNGEWRTVAPQPQPHSPFSILHSPFSFTRGAPCERPRSALNRKWQYLLITDRYIIAEGKVTARQGMSGSQHLTSNHPTA
jgi:hypothetical protein